MRKKLLLINLFTAAVVTASLIGCQANDNKVSDNKENSSEIENAEKESLSDDAAKSDNKTNKTAKNDKKSDKEEAITFDWYVNYSWFVTGWGENMVSKKITEETGVSLNFITPKGNEYEKDGKYYDREMDDMVNDTPVIKREIAEVLNTDRERYDREYGADNTYWMLQNNVMQLKWQTELEEPLKQLAEWTYPYTYYLGQYEIPLI